MKKLFIPTFAFTALLLATGGDMNKRSADLGNKVDRTTILTTDEVTTSEAAPVANAASYGDSAGSAAAGNAVYHKPARITRTAHPVTTESDDSMIYDDVEYDDIDQQAMEDRQSMEEAEYRTYPVEEYESEDAKLNRLQKENSIFYGYPSATGASGAPGSAELAK